MSFFNSATKAKKHLGEWFDAYGISNGDASLKLNFNENQKIGEFVKYYDDVVTLCQFLLFRENIGFNKVSLLKKNKQGFLSAYADCHIKDHETWTEKDDVRSITFRDLGENVVKLLNTISANNENKPSYCINFLPKDDNDVMRMGNTKLRDICSAIECEMEIAKINATSNEEFNKLISSIKEIVKKHRSSDTPLDSKTYDYIFGSINHWNQAVADRIYTTYLLHKKEINVFLKNMDYDFTQESVNELIKYRNKITHGMYKVVDRNVYYSAVVVGALVYCCVLSRIGVSDKKIIKLMERCVLLY